MAEFENHPDYDKNVKKLQAQGYGMPTASEMEGKIPADEEMDLLMLGTILANAQGQRKHVDFKTGEVSEIEPVPPGTKLKLMLDIKAIKEELLTVGDGHAPSEKALAQEDIVDVMLRQYFNASAGKREDQAFLETFAITASLGTGGSMKVDQLKKILDKRAFI